MRRKMFSIWSVLLALIISLAVLAPSCESTEEGGTIIVKATLCGAPWEGVVNFTLTESEGNIINPGGATPIGITYDGVRTGIYTADFLDGGPPEAILVDIVPEETQAVTSGGTVIFTLNFEKKQDASIEFLNWTVNGIPLEQFEGAVYFEGEWLVDTHPYDVIGVQFTQHVAGCQGYQVAVNETSELSIYYSGALSGDVYVSVANNVCAVIKEPDPIEKVSQVTSFNGEPVQPGELFEIPDGQVVTLDVETGWLLEKEKDYTKTINWWGISELPGETECVLFDLIVEDTAFPYQFELVASAEVKLVDDTDVNPGNNEAVSFPIYLSVHGS